MSEKAEKTTNGTFIVPQELPPVVRHFGAVLAYAEQQKQIDRGVCPQCGDRLTHEGGCLLCRGCGWSACE